LRVIAEDLQNLGFIYAITFGGGRKMGSPERTLQKDLGQMLVEAEIINAQQLHHVREYYPRRRD